MTDSAEAIKTALIAAGCDTGDGSYVHAAMDSDPGFIHAYRRHPRHAGRATGEEAMSDVEECPRCKGSGEIAEIRRKNVPLRCSRSSAGRCKGRAASTCFTCAGMGISNARMTMIDAVIEELKTHQTQLDQDGVMVGVSRQALEELLAHVAEQVHAERRGDNTIQRDKIYRAAERSNTRFGQWIPERWVNIFAEEMSK